MWYPRWDKHNTPPSPPFCYGHDTWTYSWQATLNCTIHVKFSKTAVELTNHVTQPHGHRLKVPTQVYSKQLSIIQNNLNCCGTAINLPSIFIEVSI